MKQNFVTKKVKLDDNSVLIKKFIKGIEGGRTLDVTDFADDVIKCGWLIASKTVSGAKVYFPCKLNEGKTAYAALGSGEKYEGILYSSILKEKPAAAIMTWGIVNEEALPYAMPEAAKTALPYIDLQKDEEA